MKVTKKPKDWNREAWEAASVEVSDEGGAADEKREEIDDENSSTTSSEKLVGVAKQLFAVNHLMVIALIFWENLLENWIDIQFRKSVNLLACYRRVRKLARKR